MTHAGSPVTPAPVVEQANPDGRRQHRHRHRCDQRVMRQFQRASTTEVESLGAKVHLPSGFGLS